MKFCTYTLLLSFIINNWRSICFLVVTLWAEKNAASAQNNWHNYHSTSKIDLSAREEVSGAYSVTIVSALDAEEYGINIADVLT